MNEILKALQEFRDEIKNEISELREEMTDRFDKIDEKLDAIAATANDDVITILERIDRRTNYLEKDMELLTGKVANHERLLNRLENN